MPTYSTTIQGDAAAPPAPVTIANATLAVTGTFFQATQPISAASLPLPTGAALDASVTGLQVTQGSTTSGQKGALDFGAVTTAAPTYVTGQSSPLSLDTSGNLRVTLAAGTIAANITQIGGSAISLGQKTMANSSPIVIASDQSAVPVSASDTTPANGSVTTQDIASASGAGANGQVFIIGTPTAGSAAVFALNGFSTVRVQVSGIWTGTLVTEVSTDGTIWVQANTLQQTGLTNFTGSFTNSFHGTVSVSGATSFRVRATAAITGTAVVHVVESSTTSNVFVANPLTIGGTVAATQSGTWNITNVSGTVSLPTGAATSALQTTGNTSLSTLAGAVIAQGSTTSGQSGELILGAVTTAAPTYVTAQSSALSLDTSGRLRTDNSSWLGSTAPTVGSKTSANSIPVVIASDQGNVPVSQATASNLNAQVVGTVASGAADSGNPVKIGGVFNTTQPTLTNGQRGDAQLDNNAQLIVSGPGSYKATYMASILGLASAATATDIFTIIGSATKTIRILKIGISGLSTAGTRADIQVIKRSAADTGGTSSTPTIVPLDSSSAAGTAVVRAYTANPTALGAAVGTIVTMKLDIPTAATTNGIMEQLIEFTDNAAGIALRGVAQQIAVNLNGVTIGGSSFDIYITWTEE